MNSQNEYGASQSLIDDLRREIQTQQAEINVLRNRLADAGAVRRKMSQTIKTLIADNRELKARLKGRGSPQYTVVRCHKNGGLYGSRHGSDDGQVTICGEVIDDGWVITHNDFDGDVTCHKCKRALK